MPVYLHVLEHLHILRNLTVADKLHHNCVELCWQGLHLYTTLNQQKQQQQKLSMPLSLQRLASPHIQRYSSLLYHTTGNIFTAGGSSELQVCQKQV